LIEFQLLTIQLPRFRIYIE